MYKRQAVQVVTVPVVLAVGNAPCAYLRVPTLKDKMKFGKRPIEHISLDRKLAESQSRNVELMELAPIDDSRDTIRIEGETPQEKAEKMCIRDSAKVCTRSGSRSGLR